MRNTFIKLILALGALAFGAMWVVLHQPDRDVPPETPLVSNAPRADHQPLRILAVTEQELPTLSTTPTPRPARKNMPSPTVAAAVTATATVCEQGSCVNVPKPNVTSAAVSDGTWWYYYENQEQRTKNQESSKIYVRRKKAESGEVETIMESTPLTAPRGLYVSPTGKHVAFWLDNIADAKAKLTELWVYDVDSGGVRLLAEKLYQPDIRSTVRWNTMGTYLWFIADTGEQSDKADHLELILVNVNSPGKRAAFNRVGWKDLQSQFIQQPIDVSREGTSLAYPVPGLVRQSKLVIDTGTKNQQTSIRGKLSYVQWLEDNSLLYAVQDNEGFTFWRAQADTHRFVARRLGSLQSVRSDVSGHYVAFAVHDKSATVRIFSLHIDSGQVVSEGTVPATKSLQLMHVQELATPAAAKEITAEIDDAQSAAFVDQHHEEIIGRTSKPLRLIITDEPNVVFVDYLKQSQEERILLKIHDAVNTEWSIRARYEPINREWKKIQGGSLDNDPKPVRLYEWEESLGRWILKEHLTPNI